MEIGLYFKYGTMGAAKTADALITKYKYEKIDKKVLLLKPAKATRDDQYVKSRIGCYSTCEIFEEWIKSYETNLNYDLIIIDEVQFITEEEVETLVSIVDTKHIPIMCYGLRTNNRYHLFDASKKLFECADFIEEIENICQCGKKAIYNVKVAGDSINGEYIVCCRQCTMKYRK